MRLMFWKHREEKAKLDKLDREAALTHRNNVTRIVNTREKVDKLNVVLKQNNIILQLAHVTGNHK